MEIFPVGGELFRADRRTDVQTNMTKLTVALRYFANAPEKKFELTQACSSRNYINEQTLIDIYTFSNP
jgi:hypothetical protein